MNEANVTALKAVLDRIPGLGMFPDLDTGALAADLASRGCLVPAALTDEDAASLTADWDNGRFMGMGYGYTPLSEPLPEETAKLNRGASGMRAALERLARGEETGCGSLRR